MFRIGVPPTYDWSASYKAPKFTHNTLFITKGGITHRNMFDVYFKDEYKVLRDMVDENFIIDRPD